MHSMASAHEREAGFNLKAVSEEVSNGIASRQQWSREQVDLL